MNKPVVVWRRGQFRIVAVEREDEQGEIVPMLLVEHGTRDLLGSESWDLVCDHEDSLSAHVMRFFAAEIASRVEVGVPLWVQRLVREELDGYDLASSEEMGGAA